MSEVSKRYATDEVFREVADLLFGGGGDDLIHKMNPDGADLAAQKDRKKRAITAGASAIGAAAGAGGLTLAGREIHHGVKNAPKGLSRGGKLLHAVKSKRVATALLPLEVAGLGGEVMATHILHGDAKKKIKKDISEIAENAKIPSKRNLTQASITSAAHAAGKGAEYSKKKFKRLPNKVETANVKKRRPPKPGSLRAIKQDVAAASHNLKPMTDKVNSMADEAAKTSRTVRRSLVAVGTAGAGGAAAGGYGAGDKARKKFKKSDDLDLRWEGEISKIDTDKQQVFGWASIVEMNGEPVVDLQGDYITIDEVEKSAYDYVHKSRKGGDMHLRDNFGGPVSKSHMIESFVVTPEKKQSLGLPESTPTGWWVGYQVNDPGLWSKVKNGERTGFSIHGRGVRE